MAAELDSLDGRKDPQRCTLLVSQFRSCQVSGRGVEGPVVGEPEALSPAEHISGWPGRRAGRPLVQPRTGPGGHSTPSRTAWGKRARRRVQAAQGTLAEQR